MAVNLSPEQFRLDSNLVPAVIAALADSGLPAEHLELEITESVPLDVDADTLATLHRLRELNVRISLDDFGTGYSSLSYLRKFPFHKIKIDQSFVREVMVKSDCRAIVRAVVGLAKSLGMKTVAEGIETREQMSFLRAEGCDEAQGYLFSKPRPGSEAPGIVHRQKRLSMAA